MRGSALVCERMFCSGESPRDGDSFYALLERLATAYHGLEARHSDAVAENEELRARLAGRPPASHAVKAATRRPQQVQLSPPSRKPVPPSSPRFEVRDVSPFVHETSGDVRLAGATESPEIHGEPSAEIALSLGGDDEKHLTPNDPMPSENIALSNWVELTARLLEADPIVQETTYELELEPVWSLCSDYDQSQIFSRYLDKSNEHHRTKQIAPDAHLGIARVGDYIVDGSCFGLRSIDPNSGMRVLWMLCGGTFILYDTVVIPLLVFNLEETLATQIVFYTGFTYWILDVFFNFITGYHVDGRVEMRIKMTTRRYTSSWLIPDLLIICVDALLVLVEAGSSRGFLRMGRVGRFLRLCRAIRLVRILKVGETLSDMLNDFLPSEAYMIIATLLRYLVLLFFLNHYIACMFYGISGLFDDEAAETWVNDFEIADEPIRYRYVMALHWSLTQFSPATNNIAPMNYTERSFAVIVVMFALVSFSSFLSSITSLLTQLRALGANSRREESHLRSYLFSRRVKLVLRNKIWHFFRNYSRQARGFAIESKIAFLKVIPESMMMELHTEVFFKSLMSSNVFANMSTLDVVLFEKVCHIAMSESVWVNNQDVFVSGNDASTVFIVSAGRLHYSTVLDDYHEHEVTKGAWVTEITLWLRWMHCGQLHAVSPCSLVQLASPKFQQLIKKWGGPLCSCLKRFAILMLGQLEAMMRDGKLVTDLPIGDERLAGLAERALQLHRMSTKSNALFRRACSNGAETSTGTNSPARCVSN